MSEHSVSHLLVRETGNEGNSESGSCGCENRFIASFDLRAEKVAKLLILQTTENIEVSMAQASKQFREAREDSVYLSPEAGEASRVVSSD